MLNPYERSAEVYDTYYSWLDYENHAATIHDIIRAKRPAAKSLLDIACGTARYTEQLARWYDVEGLDIAESMLSVAHRRMPATTFHLANMVDFDLRTTYDALVCMFSSIAYITHLDDLRATLRPSPSTIRLPTWLSIHTSGANQGSMIKTPPRSR